MGVSRTSSHGGLSNPSTNLSEPPRATVSGLLSANGSDVPLDGLELEIRQFYNELSKAYSALYEQERQKEDLERGKRIANDFFKCGDTVVHNNFEFQPLWDWIKLNCETNHDPCTFPKNTDELRIFKTCFESTWSELHAPKAREDGTVAPSPNLCPNPTFENLWKNVKDRALISNLEKDQIQIPATDRKVNIDGTIYTISMRKKDPPSPDNVLDHSWYHNLQSHEEIVLRGEIQPPNFLAPSDTFEYVCTRIRRPTISDFLKSLIGQF